MTRPSIAELLRLVGTNPHCPHRIDELVTIRNAAPVLLEIAGAAMAWAESNSCDPNDADDLELLNAITKVRK